MPPAPPMLPAHAAASATEFGGVTMPGASESEWGGRANGMSASWDAMGVQGTDPQRETLSSAAGLARLAGPPPLAIIPTLLIGSGPAAAMAQDVFSRLLMAATADPDPAIRAGVLRVMGQDPRFAPLLALPDTIPSIRVCLRDESPRVREEAVVCLGRAARRNPLAVAGDLRTLLLDVIGDTHFAAGPRARRSSARLLAVLMRAARTLMRPYAPLIL